MPTKKLTIPFVIICKLYTYFKYIIAHYYNKKYFFVYFIKHYQKNIEVFTVKIYKIDSFLKIDF